MIQMYLAFENKRIKNTGFKYAVKSVELQHVAQKTEILQPK